MMKVSQFLTNSRLSVCSPLLFIVVEVFLSVKDESVDESDGAVLVTVTVTGVLKRDVIISFATVPGKGVMPTCCPQ